MKKAIFILVIIVTVISISSLSYALTYQEWNGYPDSPVGADLEGHPYQAIVYMAIANDQYVYRLVFSDQPLFHQITTDNKLLWQNVHWFTLNGGSWTVLQGATSLLYDWNILASRNQGEILLTNYNIYTGSSRTNVFMAANTSPEELAEGQLFPGIPSDGNSYKLVYNDPDSFNTICITSDHPAFVGTEFNTKVTIGFPFDSSCRVYTANTLYNEWSGGNEVTFTQTITNFKTINKPLRDNIYYSNYDLYNIDNTLGYWNDNYSLYGLDGFMGSTNPGTVISPITKDLDYPWYVGYISAVDGQVKLIRTDKKLTLNKGNNVFELMAERYTMAKHYIKDGSAWLLINEVGYPLEGFTYLDMISSLQNILISNYDLYTPDGSEKVYDDTESPYLDTGEPNPDANTEPTDEADNLISALFRLLDFFNPNHPDFFLIKALVPDEGFIEEKNEYLRNELGAKLGYQQMLIDLEDVSDTNPNSLIDKSYATLNVYGLGNVTAPVIDYTFYKSQQNTLNDYIRGLLYFLLIVFNVNQVYKLLHGGGRLMDGGNMEPSRGRGA